MKATDHVKAFHQTLKTGASPKAVSGVTLIAIERDRHPGLGYDDEHDDKHTRGELAKAALTYLLVVTHGSPPEKAWQPWIVRNWPWSDGFEPSDDPVRNLVKAGALIASEIDRLLRIRRWNVFQHEDRWWLVRDRQGNCAGYTDSLILGDHAESEAYAMAERLNSGNLP